MKLAAIWLAVAIPLSVVLAFTYYQWYAARISLVEQQRLGYARLAATSFELLVEEMQRSMQPAGELIAASEPASETSTVELRRVLEPFPADHLLLTDMGGRVIGASDPGMIGQDLSADTAFRAAMSSPGHAGIEPSRVASDGTVGFHVAQGIQTPNGRFSGVMLMLVDVRKLSRQFPVSVESGGISVVDSAGHVVFQNEDPRFAEQRADWGARFPIVREALRGHASSTRDFRFPLGGTRIATYVPIRPWGWAAGSSVDSGRALAPFYRSLGDALAAGASLAIASLVIALLIGRGVRGSLRLLAEDAESIGSGNLERGVRTERADEIGDVARSLETARLRLQDARGQAERELARTTVLKETAAAAASSLDPHELALRVLDALQHLLGVRAGAVHRFDETAGVLRQLATCCAGEGVESLFDEGPLKEDWVSARAVLLGKTMTYGFDELPEGTRRRAESAGEGGRGWIAVPVRAHNRVVGVLTLVFEEQPPAAREEITLFDSIADQLGIAMENGALYAAQMRSARFGGLLNDLNADIAGTLEFDEIMQRTVVRAGEALGAEAAVIEVKADDEWPVRYLWNLPRELIGRPLTGETVISRKVEETPQLLIVEDAANRADDVLARVLGRYGIRALLAVPLVVRGETTGVLIFPEYSAPRRYDTLEIDFVRKLGAAVSAALETSRLYEVEHRVAQTLQQALLALPDRIGGLAFAHEYRSATQMARVGGDFYDIFEIEHGLVGITVGDISGKGINAAVLTSLVKNTIRATATEDAWAPAESLRVANEVLLRWSPAEVFATVFYGVLDCRDGRFVYCSGGHTTGAVLGVDREIRTLEPNSPLVGAFHDVRYVDSETSLGVGEVLFLYTDGLTEARRGAELYGEQRVFAMLQRLAGGTPAGIVTGIVDDAVMFSGGQLSDDLAILALQRTPEAER
jgi:serine phosphatase RsbU (regulator of sigma subunit)/HAMP domain-containing protein